MEKLRISHASETHGPSGPTLPVAVRRGANQPGGFTFLQADRTEQHMSFGELAEEVDRRAMQLRAMGLVKGDRVGFIVTTSNEFIISFLGYHWFEVVSPMESHFEFWHWMVVE